MLRSHLRRLAVVLLLAVPILTGAYASAETVDRRAFAQPPLQVRPLVRWWWPGGDVNDAQLARELRTMRDAGFGGAEIQSFAIGLPSITPPAVFTYGTPGWFDRVAFVLDEAQRVGLTIDLTLGSSWPSGGDHIAPHLSLQQLTWNADLLVGPGEVHQVVPGVKEPLYYQLASDILGLPNTFEAAAARLVAVVAAHPLNVDLPRGRSPLPGLPDLPPTVLLDPDSLVDLTTLVGSDGTLHWDVPPGEWLLFAFHLGPTGARPFDGADPQGGLVLDHLNTLAIQEHLEAIGDVGRQRFGEHFGTTLRSVFVDSLELRSELLWTTDFATEFSRRRGYPIEPVMPLLFRPFRHDAYISLVYPDAPPTFDVIELGRRVRQDYDRTVSELMLERFFAPITAWAHRNGLSARIQAHGGPAELLGAYGRATVPETEGVFAGGRRPFLKMASSAGHVYGRPLISSEVLAFPSDDAFSRPTDILREINAHFAAGVNQVVLHGFPYVYDVGFPPPGWMPFNSPFGRAPGVIPRFGTHLNDRNPFWNTMPRINDYIARAQLILRTGQPETTLAFYTGRLEYPNDPLFSSPTASELEKAGYSYDYINAESLRAARVVDRTLTVGERSYKGLVVADVNAMEPAVALKLVELARQGLPIVVANTIPLESIGWLDFEKNDAVVRLAFDTLFGHPAADVLRQRNFGFGSTVFVARSQDVPLLLLSYLGLAPDVVLGSEGRDPVRFAHRRTASADYYFLTNESHAPLTTGIGFPNPTRRVPELWDLHRGRVTVPPIYSHSDGLTTVELHFEPGNAVVVGFERPTTTVHVSATDLPRVERENDGSLTGISPQPGSYGVALGQERRANRVDFTAPPLPSLELPRWNLVTTHVGAAGSTFTREFEAVPLRDLSQVTGLGDFAGIAVYTATVTIPAPYLEPGRKLLLDLGAVHDTADVRVNDEPVDLLLSSPFQIDIGRHVRQGSNTIAVTVTTSPNTGPSGLMGPARLVPLHALPLHGPGEPMSVVVNPARVPNSTAEDTADAISLAAQVVDHVNFEWFWTTPPSQGNPEGGRVVPCRDVVSGRVAHARSLGLGVTLQFQTFFLDVSNANSFPTVRITAPGVDFASASYTDPEVADAFLDEVACLAGLEPEFFVLGTEINFLVTFAPIEYFAFIALYQQAYHLVKVISPTTRVGLSYQYDGLRMSLPEDNWWYIPFAGPYDFVGLTSYFGYSPRRLADFPTPANIPSDYFHPARSRLGNTPLLFTELGWSSFDPVTGQDDQVRFLRRLPELLGPVEPVGIVWPLLHDVAFFKGAIDGHNLGGLIDIDGVPKPAWYELQRLKATGALRDIDPPVPGTPFSVTAVPPHSDTPAGRAEPSDFAGIALAAELGRHISLQRPWYDPRFKETWDCARIGSRMDEARRLGLEVTLQFSTYSTVFTPDREPKVLVLNPLLPPDPDGVDAPDISLEIPAIRDAFLEQIACLASYKPQYLVLGPEVNLIESIRPAEFHAFATVYRAAYNVVKAISPSTQVGTSYQYDLARHYILSGDDPALDVVSPQDFIGLTSYFGTSFERLGEYPAPEMIPADYYAPIRQLLGPQVPIVVTEIAWSSFFPANVQHQVDFLDRLPGLMQPLAPKNVIWALLHDIAFFQHGALIAHNADGLLTIAGTPKPSWIRARQLRRAGVYVTP